MKLGPKTYGGADDQKHERGRESDNPRGNLANMCSLCAHIHFDINSLRMEWVPELRSMERRSILLAWVLDGDDGRVFDKTTVKVCRSKFSVFGLAADGERGDVALSEDPSVWKFTVDCCISWPAFVQNRFLERAFIKNLVVKITFMELTVRKVDSDEVRNECRRSKLAILKVRRRSDVSLNMTSRKYHVGKLAVPQIHILKIPSGELLAGECNTAQVKCCIQRENGISQNKPLDGIQKRLHIVLAEGAFATHRTSQTKICANKICASREEVIRMFQGEAFQSCNAGSAGNSIRLMQKRDCIFITLLKALKSTGIVLLHSDFSLLLAYDNSPPSEPNTKSAANDQGKISDHGHSVGIRSRPVLNGPHTVWWWIEERKADNKQSKNDGRRRRESRERGSQRVDGVGKGPKLFGTRIVLGHGVSLMGSKRPSMPRPPFQRKVAFGCARRAQMGRTA